LEALPGIGQNYYVRSCLWNHLIQDGGFASAPVEFYHPELVRSIAADTSHRVVGRSIGGYQYLESFLGVIEREQVRDAVLEAIAFVVSDDDDRDMGTRLSSDRRPIPEVRYEADQRRVPEVGVQEERNATPKEPLRPRRRHALAHVQVTRATKI
jgi:hypothetical protein